MHRWMVSIDYFLCSIRLPRKTLECISNDLIDWWGHNMFNNLLHWMPRLIRIWPGGVVRIFLRQAGSGRCDFQLARQSIAEINETLHENLKNDVDSNFRFALLLCCVVKNYLSFRSACVSSSGVPHDPGPGRISSRTRLSRRQVLNYMLSINL